MRKVLAVIAGLSSMVLAPWLSDAAKFEPTAVITHGVPQCTVPNYEPASAVGPSTVPTFATTPTTVEAHFGRIPASARTADVAR